MAIIDVEQSAVEQTMLDFGVQQLIHGHTHRQDVHEFQLNGKKATRTVLGDWYEKDCVLVCRNSEQKMMRVEAYLSLE